MGTEREILEARLRDAIQKCERGSVAILPFLDPRDSKICERLLRASGKWESAWLWGGHKEAERKTLFLLPEYLTVCLSDLPTRCDEGEVLELLGEEATEAVCALRITGSGFRVLSHRDYLGSVLALGIERGALGDIAVQNEREAVLFCSSTMSLFLREHLTRVAADGVKVTQYVPDDRFTDGKRYEHISDTVASDRLDCVVAALCNLSRENAQALIRNDAVDVDFEPVLRTDLTVSAPATLSIRGYGRFILRSYDGETRKGRLRLRADKLV